MPKSLFFLLLLAFSLPLSAQTTEGEENARRDLDYYSDADTRRPVEERFSDNLWFGGGGTLNFFASNGISVFVVGLSPMVGYKVTPNLSFGPRLSLNYNAIGCGNDNSYNYFNWEAGLFARHKLFQQFFVHAEYSLENRRLLFNDCSEPLKQTRSMPYLGAGYTSGFEGGLGTEILLLFRLRQDGQGFIESPYVIRFGLNFNF